jgi:ribosome-associated protein
MPALLKYSRESYLSEATFETARSGGKGGQHVNKTESKVTLIFDLNQTALFTEEEKIRIAKKLGSHYHDGIIRVSSETSRSQFQNKSIATERFFEILEKALFVQKKRIPTKISKGKKEKRLQSKKISSEKKKFRRKPGFD